MKLPSFHPKWFIVTCLALWALFLLIIATPNLTHGNPFFFSILPHIASLAALSTLVAVGILFFNVSDKREMNKALTAKPVNNLLNKGLATILLGCLVIGTFAAIHSLPMDGTTAEKFVF